MFAVNGQDGNIAFAGGCGENLAGGDHAFLVGKANGFSRENCGMGSFKTGDAYDGRHDEIGLWMGRACHRACTAVHNIDPFDSLRTETGRELNGKFFSCQ